MDFLACSSLRFFGLIPDRFLCLAALYEHFPRPVAYRITSAVWEMIGVGCVFHDRHLFIRGRIDCGSKKDTFLMNT